MDNNRLIKIKNSSLWAAYGDALGFITELADENRVAYRLGKKGITKVVKTADWTRTIGGRFGAKVKLVAGTYSDDTQLRLATSRAIRKNGEFDVEAFAKVELPIWLGYSLGAGVGTKTAANNLRNSGVNWFSNFFKTDKRDYIQCGGNGAAMRIQPHVWCSKDPSDSTTFLLDIFKNSICTHGHPRGFIGALFHGLSLAKTLESSTIPSPKDWMNLLDEISTILPLIRSDDELGNFWLPNLEKEHDKPIDKLFLETINEIKIDINKIIDTLEEENDYKALVQSVKGFDKTHRGTGTKTAILANALSWLYRDKNPNEAIIEAANLLGTDTDTISTMAGALLGVNTNHKPNGVVLDDEYLLDEAKRMYNISIKDEETSFSYPDIQKWDAPKNNVDTLQKRNNKLILVGLGYVLEEGQKFKSKSKNEFYWQLLKLEFGQTVICKRRGKIKEISPNNLPPVLNNKITNKFNNKEEAKKNKKEILDKEYRNIINEAKEKGITPTTIGEFIFETVNQEHGLEKILLVCIRLRDYLNKEGSD